MTFSSYRLLACYEGVTPLLRIEARDHLRCDVRAVVHRTEDDPGSPHTHPQEPDEPETGYGTAALLMRDGSIRDDVR
jgi:hypothetical protein